MYGTVARVRVKRENREALRKVLEQTTRRQVSGFMSSHVLWENDGDVGWLFAIFEDKASYEKNADDPAQHESYLEYRALMEEDPEWHDGEIESG